jgi:hypothetical protein
MSAVRRTGAAVAAGRSRSARLQLGQCLASHAGRAERSLTVTAPALDLQLPLVGLGLAVLLPVVSFSQQ